jgi:quercetin dioxygenase-like cupin family protein
LRRWFLFIVLRGWGVSQEKPKIFPRTHFSNSDKVLAMPHQAPSCAAKEEKPMITKNDVATPGQPVPVEHHDVQLALPAAGYRRVAPVLWRLGAVALLVAVAFSQVSPLQIIPLAEGIDPDHNVILHMKGATDVLQTDLIFQAGATTGWHIHPGPVVVVIKSGALTEIQSNGCMIVHNAGSAFFESPDEVHNVVNQTRGVTEVLATFLSPAGSQPLIPVPDPGSVCRK